MSSAPGIVLETRFRHRIKDIQLSPSRSKYPVELELAVDSKKPIKLPRIKANEDLRWDLGLLPCDVNSASGVVLKVIEVHSINDRIGSATYTMSEVDGQSLLVRDTRDAQPQKHLDLFSKFSNRQDTWTVTLHFLNQKEVDAAYSEAIKKSTAAMQSTAGPLDRMGNAAHVFKTILGFGTAIAELNSSAKLVVALITQTWQILEKQQELHDNMKRLIKGLDRILPVVESVKAHSREKMVQDTILRLLDLVEDASYFLMVYLSKPELARAMFGAFDGKPKERLDELMKDLEDFRKDFDTRINAELLKLTVTAEQRVLIGRLTPSGRSHYSSSSQCQTGTRVQLLGEIHGWTGSQIPEQKMIWLHGQAGLGKSSIAGSVCRKLDSEKTLGSHFFCKRDDADRRNPDIVLNTIIYRLATRYEPYGRLVAEAIQNDVELPDAPMEQRYMHLVQKPLHDLKKNDVQPDRTLVVVVDALDECEQGAGRRLLLRYLREACQLVPWLKVLATSRPDADITSAYGPRKIDLVSSYDARDYDASGDISAYIEKRMSAIACEQEYHGWSTESSLRLSERADGLFIWAETACKFIEDGFDMDDRLQQILDDTQSARGILPLDSLYATAINQGMGDEKEDNVQAVRHCLGAILTASVHTPLSAAGIESLMAGTIKPGIVGAIVKRLRSVLYEDNIADKAVRIYHQSFADYLATETRSGRFYLDPGTQNETFARRCLEIMLKGLKFNICELETSHVLNRDVPELENRVRDAVGEDLKYSCRHWSSHLVKGTETAPGEVLDEFLFGPKLLYWMEVLSLLGELAVGLRSLQRLKHWFSDPQDLRSQCAEDAYRFLLSFYEAISQSTPHLYVSALALVPKESGIARRIHRMFPNVLKANNYGNEGWTQWLKSFSHEDSVTSVAISPDGKRIVSGSLDNIVRIWHTETGQLACAPLVGHSDRVWSVAFSGDGKIIASGSSDTTVRIWYTETGQPVFNPLIGHVNAVLCVACSGDGKRIASSAYDYTVRVWNIEAEEPTSYRLVGHSEPVWSVAFSSDGKRIVSGSDDNTIRTWNTETGQPISAPLVEHSSAVSSVAFSADGKRIVSNSEDDNTVRIWDAETGQPACSPLVGHSKKVLSVAFSEDGKRIVSGSFDRTVQIWDAETGEPASAPLVGHSSAVVSAIFSRDGKQIVTASEDKTVRIWDAETVNSGSAPLEGHSDWVTSVTFSRNGKHIISGSVDKTVRIWDAKTGQPAFPMLIRHSNLVYSVASSSDGKRIVSGSSNKTVRIWDAETGQPAFAPLEGHSSAVKSVVFSHDGRRIVTGSEDKTIRIWDAATGQPISAPLIGHSNYVSCVAVSSDGTRIASGSYDYTVRIWDTDTGQPVSAPLVGHSSAMSSIAFSPNGKRIVSSSDDNTVCIWCVEEGQPVSTPLVGHPIVGTSVTFSPDGKHIASGSSDKTVRIWDAETGQPAYAPLVGHLYVILCVAFSGDGKRIVTGSYDKTVRIWDMEVSLAFSSCISGLLISPSSHASASISANHAAPVLDHQIEPKGLLSSTSQLARHLLPGSGWVSLGSVILLWLPPEYRQVDDSFICISEAPLSSPLLLDFSRFMHGSQWARIIG